MINWPSKAAPCIRPIGAERSEECAAIHATSFAYPWKEADFEQLFVASGTFAEGAVALVLALGVLLLVTGWIGERE